MRGKPRHWWVLAALLAVAGLAVTRQAVVAQAAGQRAASTEGWYGAYLQGRKIGYMSESIHPVTRDGHARLEYVSKNYASLEVLGQRMEQTSAWVSLCDLDFRPLDLQFTLSSGGRSSAITAKFTATTIDYTKTTGAATTSGQVPIPKGTKLVVDGQALLAGRRLKTGERLTVQQFNPVSLAIEDCTLEFIGTEPVVLPGETVDGQKVHVTTPMVQADAWVDAAGRTLKVEAAMMQAKLEYRRETQAQAVQLEDEHGPRIDLVVATAIHPHRPITDAARVNRAVLRVQGLDKLPHVPQDSWQTIEPAADGWRRVTIDGRLAPAPKLSLPLSAAQRKELAAYLAATPYIEADHPEMTAKAQEIVGDEHDLARATSRIHDWVNQHIRWQSNIGLFRSGREILRDPAGVCRDSAALYASLARAAGIPTRVCAGLVWSGGAFLGHAWAESWCGGWRPVDATTPGEFVNATHLKLASGANYTCVFEMLPALGALQIEVDDLAWLPAEGAQR